MKPTLLAKDLLLPASYARQRTRLRAAVLAHRKDRVVRIGSSATLVFESVLTVRFRLQEILRREAISGDEAVQAAIDAHASLIPDGTNLKATFRLEFVDAGERASRLAQLAGVETFVWMQLDGSPRVYALADRDPAHAAADHDDAQHHLRFELGEPIAHAFRRGRALSFGIDHPAYTARAVVGDNVRRSLLGDLR